MKIDIGSYVRIAGNFPSNRNLQDQTGTIESLPNKEHRREYLVKLDGGGTVSPHLAGMLVWVLSCKLELANKN
jgi:hypothetical protein